MRVLLVAAFALVLAACSGHPSAPDGGTSAPDAGGRITQPPAA